MKKTCLFALSLVLLMGSAAHAGPIEDRQAAMKRIGALVGRELAPYARGDKPYDATAVLATLQTLDTEAKAFDVETLFPAGTETGDTKVSTKIWEDRPGFQAAVGKFAGDIAAAVTAAPQNLAAFGPLFDTIGGSCRACHSAWRN